MWAQIINALLGVWLMAAPAVLHYAGAASINDRILGPLAVSCAIIAISEVTRPVRWVNLGLGLWLLTAPWVFGAEWFVVLHSTIIGLLLALFASVRGRGREQFGGGWAVLWSAKTSDSNAPQPPSTAWRRQSASGT